MNDFATGDLIAIDPSVVKPGAALFRGGKLIAAERVRLDADLKELPFAGRCGRVAEAIVRWGIALEMHPRTLVYELPRFYSARAGKTKGDQNDLRGLIAVSAEVAGILRMAAARRDEVLSVLAFEPAEWTGQILQGDDGGPLGVPARVEDQVQAVRRGVRGRGSEPRRGGRRRARAVRDGQAQAQARKSRGRLMRHSMLVCLAPQARAIVSLEHLRPSARWGHDDEAL